MGVRRAGFRPLLFNERNNLAGKTLLQSAASTLAGDGIELTESTKPEAPKEGQAAPLYLGPVEDLNLSLLQGKVDVLAGGPPCQPFSTGGVSKGDEDKRNMFPAMFKAIRETQPKAVLCENVRGLTRESFADYFQYILNELELPFVERDDSVRWQDHDAHLRRLINSKAHEIGDQRYIVRHFAVNAADYGVPQIRHRVVIVAFRADLDVDIAAFTRKVMSAPYSREALIESMRGEDGAYWQRYGSSIPEEVRERVRSQLPPDKGQFPVEGSRPWRTLRDAITGNIADPPLPALPAVDLGALDRVTEQAEHLGITDHVGWPDARVYKGHTANQLDKPAKTVKAGVHGVAGGELVLALDPPSPVPHRYMTVREAARVMTFPDEWKGAGPRSEKMRQLGNAVPVLLSEFFARAVAKALEDAER
jgi:DNA (cytosine-5)-methyltransferase 1